MLDELTAKVAAADARDLHVFILPPGRKGLPKYAWGSRGRRAIKVVREVSATYNAAGQRLPVYAGVTGRRPIIPLNAPILPRGDCGRLLLTALGQ